MDPSYQGRVPQVPYNNSYGRRRGPRLSPRALLLIGIGLAAVIIAIVLLANSGDKTIPLQQRLSARMSTLEKMSSDGKKNLVSGDLKEFNGRLSIQLISDQKTLGELMTLGKVDKALTTSEADAASFKSLDDARLNSNYDTTYRRIVSQKLDSTTVLMRELYDTTRSQKLKEALGGSYRSLKELEKQLTPTTTQ